MPPPLQPVDFLAKLLRTLRPLHPPPRDSHLDDIRDLPSAISLLRDSTGITREYLCHRTGLTKQQLLTLESRGRPLHADTLRLLHSLAEEFRLPNLAEFFHNTLQDLLRNTSPSSTKRR